MRVDEYNVIASAVRLDEIPPQYRKLPLLGRGATSLAFAKDANTVLMFTRDRIKAEWLRDGLRMVRDQRVVQPVRWHHIPGMQKHDLIMIEMPRLYPLSPANRSVVVRETQAFTKLTREIGLGSNRDWGSKLADTIEAYREQYPNSHILPFLEWVANYDPRDFFLDIGPRQYKQTAQGDIVLLDPVVAADLLNLLSSKGRR